MSLGRPGWLDEGEEPDYRFSLANERTFLAWIRTSLALLAAAVGVVQLASSFQHGARTALGVALALAGLGSGAFTYVRWAANERAMRHSKPLPYTRLLALLSVGLGIIGLAVLVLVILAKR